MNYNRQFRSSGYNNLSGGAYPSLHDYYTPYPRNVNKNRQTQYDTIQVHNKHTHSKAHPYTYIRSVSTDTKAFSQNNVSARSNWQTLGLSRARKPAPACKAISRHILRPRITHYSYSGRNSRLNFRRIFLRRVRLSRVFPSREVGSPARIFIPFFPPTFRPRLFLFSAKSPPPSSHCWGAGFLCARLANARVEGQDVKVVRTSDKGEKETHR